MNVSKIRVKTALTKSKIPGVDYVINPYLGCGHGCKYCYAAFMTRWSRCHVGAQWGTFVEVKSNIAEALLSELRRKRKRSTAFLSSTCDPYQPVEARYKLTRRCLELLLEYGWAFDILTRSPLVVRDSDLFRSAVNVTVGLSIPTENDRVRQILEPHSPPIASRVAALKELHEAGVVTWVFIGPMLPMDPERLHEAIGHHVDHVLIDRLNYAGKVARLFHKNQWDHALTYEYAVETELKLLRLFGDKAKVV